VTVRGVLAPLVRGSTWRRAMFLLLGGVLVLPYALLAAAFAQLLGNDDVPRPMRETFMQPSLVIYSVLRGFHL
jgi:hypothetical protein